MNREQIFKKLTEFERYMIAVGESMCRFMQAPNYSLEDAINDYALINPTRKKLDRMKEKCCKLFSETQMQQIVGKRYTLVAKITNCSYFDKDEFIKDHGIGTYEKYMKSGTKKEWVIAENTQTLKGKAVREGIGV